MPRPNTTANFGPEAVSQLALAVEAGVNAANTGTPTPFLTGEAIIASPPAVTQLPPQATPSGVMLRPETDVYINSTNSVTGGIILYEGDDIRFENVTDLDQVFVLPLKNQATVIRWMTL